MIFDATAPELVTDSSLQAFLSDFEQCAIPKEQWTHAAHVAMAGAYLLAKPVDAAIDAARTGIQRFNRHHGGDPGKYHETLTCFWVHVCHALLNELGLPGAEGVRALVTRYGRRGDLYREYYSYDVGRDDGARTAWQPPDLQPLPAAWRKGGLLLSTNPRLLHLDTMHAFLKTTYWAEAIPRETLARGVRNSLVFGVYAGPSQIAMARVITDFATFGYLADVFVAPEYRSQGVAKWIMESVKAHPSLQGFRRWMLVTRDAQSLYDRYGFLPVRNPERWMEIARPRLYKELEEAGIE